MRELDGAVRIEILDGAEELLRLVEFQKPGAQLEDAYKSLEWALAEAFPSDGSPGRLQRARSSTDAEVYVRSYPITPADHARIYWRPSSSPKCPVSRDAHRAVEDEHSSL